jgi:hypothetical protein
MGHVSWLPWLHKRNQGRLEVEEINPRPSQQLTAMARISQKVPERADSCPRSAGTLNAWLPPRTTMVGAPCAECVENEVDLLENDY